MEELIQEAQLLIQNILQLHPTRDRQDGDRLYYQLYQIIDQLETLPEKLHFLFKAGCNLSTTDIREKLVR